MQENNQLMLKKLNRKMVNLTKSKFDEDLFQYRRNYILGTYVVSRLLNDPFITWEGAYTVKKPSQHWLWVLMNHLREINPKLSEEITYLYGIKLSEIYNDDEDIQVPIGLATNELFSLIMHICTEVLTSLPFRIEVQKLIADELKSLQLAREAEVIKLLLKINKLSI